jgi:trans-aconitate 2-methyltransferase
LFLPSRVGKEETRAMPTDSWDPEQYERFHDERSRPFFDLLALVHPRRGMRVVDLGCGTGELTRHLHDEIRGRDTLGIDRSPAMLAKADAVAGEGLRFEQGDIASFVGRELDLVFSNAALHWVPDHAALFARLTEALSGGGQLAVQMPANFDHPSHVVAAEVRREAEFRDALADVAEAGSNVLPPEGYATLLERLGYLEQEVRLQVYGHHLDSPDEVVEWVKGTLLTEVERRLEPDAYAAFLARYRERLLPRLADTRPYFFTFKRILLWGRH